MALVMRTCSRHTRTHLISTPFLVLQCCVVRVFYMLSSLFVHLARLSSGASQWRWSIGQLALASVTSHKELAQVMHTSTQRDGSGDAGRGADGGVVVGIRVMRTCSRCTRACLLSAPFVVLQWCVAWLFYMLSSLRANLLTLNSGANQWRWPMGLLALATGTAHKARAPMMHTGTLGDGVGDAHLQQIHKSSLNAHPFLVSLTVSTPHQFRSHHNSHYSLTFTQDNNRHHRPQLSPKPPPDSPALLLMCREACVLYFVAFASGLLDENCRIVCPAFILQ